MFTTKITLYTLIIAVFAVAAFSVPVSFSSEMNVETSTVSAWAGGTDDGQGGCCGGSDPKPKPPTPTTPTPKPAVCQYINADKVTLPYGGGDVVLTWASSRANSATLTPTGSSVAVNGSKTVSVAATTQFILRVTNNDGADTCRVNVTVAPQPQALPTCDAFTASPARLPYGGGTAALTWATTNATAVSIDNGVGTVSVDGTKNVAVTQSITYTLTAANAVGSVTCPAPIVVEPPVTSTITCAQNVTFTASTQSLPKGGGDVGFTWTTTGLDTVSFTGLVATNLSGNETKSIGSDETVTLIGTKNGVNISCPLQIDVRTGGGHSSSPRCSIDLSDEKITAGQEITLTWDTTRAREVKITDNHGKTLLDTEDSREFDGSMKLKPKKNTEYTVVSKRGTRERTCKVDVKMENSVTVLQTRSVEPRVAGISLTQVPYTGFDAGPVMTTFFYLLLTIWGLFVAYVFVIRRDSLGGVSFAGSHDHVSFTDVSTDADPVTNEPLAEEYVDIVVASTASVTAPANLPVAAPTIGYAATLDDEQTDESIAMTELENRAHAQKVLLSSDAMRFFMNTTDSEELRNQKLDTAIAAAKGSFPSEGGWTALNLERLEVLTTGDEEAVSAVVSQTQAITGGSLAEAIVEGNIVAAYQMIASRPMIALADAAADLDSVYRSRKGEEVSISELLTTSTSTLSTEKIEAAIAALTSAVDGTYADEASAVKMAIMKAVKAVS